MPVETEDVLVKGVVYMFGGDGAMMNAEQPVPQQRCNPMHPGIATCAGSPLSDRTVLSWVNPCPFSPLELVLTIARLGLCSQLQAV